MEDLKEVAMYSGGLSAVCALVIWYAINRSGVQQWLDDLWDGGKADDLRKRFDAFGWRKKRNLMRSIPAFLMEKIEERAYESKAQAFIRAFKTLAEIGMNGMDDRQREALVHAYVDNKMCDDTFDYDGACLMAAQLWTKIPEVLAIRLCSLDADIGPIMKHVSDYAVESGIRLAIEEGDGKKLLRITEALPDVVSDSDILDCMRNAQDEANIGRCFIARKDWDGAESHVDRMQDEEEAGRLLLAIRRGRKKMEPVATS